MSGSASTKPPAACSAALAGPGGSGTFVRGKNAQFTLNGGPVITSKGNTFDSSVTGIAGLAVTANSQTTQTVSVSSDTASMQSAIQSVLTNFNSLQDLIHSDTVVQTSGGTTTT